MGYIYIYIYIYSSDRLGPWEAATNKEEEHKYLCIHHLFATFRSYLTPSSGNLKRNNEYHIGNGNIGSRITKVNKYN